jgi:hypothetical protein
MKRGLSPRHKGTKEEGFREPLAKGMTELRAGFAYGSHQIPASKTCCRPLWAVLYGRRPSSEAVLKSFSFFLSTVALRFTMTAHRRTGFACSIMPADKFTKSTKGKR